MNRFLLLAVSALLALPTVAQTEEDVTSYIQNPGFDEDITWGINGETKEIVVNNIAYNEGRSQGWMAADSTIYAHSTGSRNRKDDIPSTSAWNGFLGRVQGWTVESGNKLTPEWVYFGTVPYGLGERAIPIADDGDTCLQMPEKPAEDSGDDNKAALYLRAGWGGWATYSQTVELPAAEYRLEYMVLNANFANSQNNTGVKNLCQVVGRNEKETFKDDEGFNAQQWTKHSIEFKVTSSFTIQFGFQSSGGSNTNPFIWIDGIKLYKIGEIDPGKLLEADLSDVIGQLQEMMEQATNLGMAGLINEMGDYMDEIDGVIGADVSVMEAALKKSQTDLANFQKAMDAHDGLTALIAKMDQLIQTTSYPGLNDLIAALESAMNTLQDGTSSEILALEAFINQALAAYYMSQQATEESPADFTFLVKNPWFIQPQYEPVFDGTNYVYEVEAPADYQTSEGWYQGSFTSGDQRLNYTQGRTCWNAWASGFTADVSISQDLTDLPNGYYKVAADLITQADYITNQHVFARSTAQESSSPTMTVEGWDAIESGIGIWETLTTEEKVLVVDGKLTIGALGTGSGTASAGWFCATNFKLYYLGEADANALQQAFSERVAEADELLASMHFAGDKQALKDSLDAYRNSADLIAALSAINAALSTARASEAKYEEYMMEGKTLPTVEATLAGEGYGEGTDFIRFAYDYVQQWLVSDTASYVDIDAQVNLLKNYLNTYLPVFQEAAQVADAASEAGKAYLRGVMDAQKAQLVSEMQDADAVNALVETLRSAMSIVNKQNIYDDASATDYTAFIQNPKAEATTGWEVEKGTGDGPTKVGQWYCDTETRYFDSWNGSGLSGFILKQTITDLPNGVYTLGVYTRAPSEGAYVFYGVDGITNYVEIPLNYHLNEETGEEEVASDRFGPIWEDAKVKINVISETDPDYALISAIYNANNGEGRGWQHQEMAGIEVTDHQLTIGTTSGGEELGTEKIFAGNWYSVGGWTLTLTQKGDNSGWAGPIAAGITTATTGTQAPDGIYSLTGVRLGQLQRGMNIIVSGGQARKLMVK